MPLPKLEVPTYTTELPSTGQTIKYRPFLVKEEKVLLTAIESEDEKQIQDAVLSLLKSCITSRIRLEKLAMFDLEYLFLQIRAKSVSEELELKVICNDDETTEVDVKIDLNDVNVTKPDDHTKQVYINDSVTILMNYPSIDQFIKSNFSTEQTAEEVFDLIADCIEQIIDGDEVYEASAASKKELVHFLESLTSKQFESVQTFFQTMPKLKHSFKVLNPNTKVESEYTLEGLASFFG
tara:strand:+ start:15380 stop:16090 length:711 start_codon:yes stop_codon:yes gene_type:complete